MPREHRRPSPPASRGEENSRAARCECPVRRRPPYRRLRVSLVIGLETPVERCCRVHPAGDANLSAVLVISRLQTARPRPGVSPSALNPGSKMRSIMCFGMPQPVSAISTSARALPAAIHAPRRDHDLPPAGVWRIALQMRFSMIWRSRSRCPGSSAVSRAKGERLTPACSAMGCTNSTPLLHAGGQVNRRQMRIASAVNAQHVVHGSREQANSGAKMETHCGTSAPGPRRSGRRTAPCSLTDF
jgi:hypothetical protein